MLFLSCCYYCVFVLFLFLKMLWVGLWFVAFSGHILTSFLCKRYRTQNSSWIMYALVWQQMFVHIGRGKLMNEISHSYQLDVSM